MIQPTMGQFVAAQGSSKLAAFLFYWLPKAMKAALLGISLGLLMASSALASSVYPRELRAGLDLEETPACTLCHRGSRGGPNTATLSFAETLKDYGLEGKGEEELLREAVLAALDTAADGDEDGSPDVLEMILGSSPNDPDSRAGSGGWGGGAAISASIPWREGPTSSWIDAEESDADNQHGQACALGIPGQATSAAWWISPLVLGLKRNRRRR